MCKGYGGPELNIIWHQGGREISDVAGFSTIHEEYVNENGRLLKQSSLHLSNLISCDSGELHCEVTDFKTSYTSSLWIDVTGMLPIKHRFFLTTNKQLIIRLDNNQYF